MNKYERENISGSPQMLQRIPDHPPVGAGSGQRPSGSPAPNGPKGRGPKAMIGALSVILVIVAAVIFAPRLIGDSDSVEPQPSQTSSSDRENANVNADQNESKVNEDGGSEDAAGTPTARSDAFKDEDAPGEFPVEGEIFTTGNGDYIEFFGIAPEEPSASPYCVISINGIVKDLYWITYSDDTRGNYIGFGMRGSAKEIDDFYAGLDKEQEEFMKTFWNRPCLVREEGLIASTATGERHSNPVITRHYFYRQ